MVLKPEGKQMKAPVMNVAEMYHKVSYVLRVLGPAGLLRLVISRLFSFNHYYVLGKNLSEPTESSPAFGKKTPLTEITEDDIAHIEDSLHALDAEDKREVLSRLFFYRSGFRNCYVVRNGEDIAYMQWIILPSENQIIKEKYSAKFYPLASNQVVIENAFTFPRYRGLGYLMYGTSALLDLARGDGYKTAVCYIRKDRVASLNDFTRMGFRIRRLLREYKLLGRVCRKL
jgi:hypothetical protein